jgi:hypothetical protein
MSALIASITFISFTDFRVVLSDPRIDDVIDDLAEAAFATGGEVIVVPEDAMLSSTGVAAIYRF